MKIEDNVIEEIRAHAARENPRECCGLVIIRKGKQQYIPCTNISTNGPDTFAINPEEYADAEDAGEIIRIVHSHPFASPEPSQADRVGCAAGGIPWLIINHPLGMFVEIEPDDYKAPYVGREFVHGSLDCYGLVYDYFTRELGVDMLRINRNDQWWDHGENLYIENFEKSGFVRVDDAPRKHDIFLMQIRSPVPNHAAIYLGDGMILHHLYHRLSSRDVYGGYWLKATVVQIRHRSLLNDNA